MYLIAKFDVHDVHVDRCASVTRAAIYLLFIVLCMQWSGWWAGDANARSKDQPAGRRHAAAIRGPDQEEQLLLDARRCIARGKYSQAMRRFVLVMQSDPDNAEVYAGVAQLYWERDHDSKAADVYFKIALNKPAFTPDVFVAYAKYLRASGRLDESIDYLYKALDRWPHGRNIRANMALSYFEKKNLVKACQWAASAADNHDPLRTSTLDSVCGLG